ncbi:MAG: ribosome small subunit-dependent GTPase A [Oscillatoriales cyanobacterium SM2_1_8]|nr:ribosome small subunit-dependent GTPase A [Oscillatoriales cyanobacterium SM2_1_8]
MRGLVRAVEANFYRVVLAEGEPCPELLCVRRARLKKTGQQICVGDRVIVEEPDWQGQRGAIAAVEARRSFLERPPMANLDGVLLVFALSDPPLEPWQISRFLVKVEESGLAAVVALSKADLVGAAVGAAWQARLQAWGYRAYPCSTVTGEGIEEVEGAIAGGIWVAMGPSGVGKSSLLNVLRPELGLRTGEVSAKLRHGRHTTRHVELFGVPGGGWLADAPGFLQPTLRFDPADLILGFPEARDRRGQCRFPDCEHRAEPGCAVRGAWERYEHYTTFLAEILAQTERASPETGWKYKTGKGGTVVAEPLLAVRKYRRSSRRRDRQQAADEDEGNFLR